MDVVKLSLALVLVVLLSACASRQWETAGEETGEVVEETTEAAGAVWDATVKTTSEAWEETRRVFYLKMSDREEKAFEQCVAETERPPDVTQEEAEHRCWERMKDDIREDDKAE